MQNQYVELIPLTYSGAVPAPAPACTDPTPDEQHRQAVAQKKEKLSRKEERQQHVSGGSGEMFASFKKAVSQAVISIEKGATDVSTRTEAQMRQLEYQHDCDRFRLHFYELAEQGEVLLADYRCCAMHGGNSVSGHLQITRHYLCFFAETSSSIAKTTEAVMGAFAAARQAASANASAPANVERRQRLLGIRQIISLAEIASIQPSVVLETVDGYAPFFLQLPASTVRATALQVYTTKDNKLYQFMKFESLISRASGALSECKGTALECAYNYLDHAWREAVRVPLSGVEYA
ncbi:hypothetical protein LSCM1_07413 [Leishmania martiniquensis]|uniref:GRAM domain-containing protein n=1 Tax=Leishmania martiniquensis TaxID=1580590 RepID=A0A836HTR8_9TRYP|nr:hypothetical protein LSCM1_07413 [Leishmania martiniquensis]